MIWLAFVLFGICMFIAGYCAALLGRKAVIAPEVAPEVAELEPEPIDSFEVAGKPRKPTWRQRRRELEAAARTKRKQIEEWRD